LGTTGGRTGLNFEARGQWGTLLVFMLLDNAIHEYPAMPRSPLDKKNLIKANPKDPVANSFVL